MIKEMESKRLNVGKSNENKDKKGSGRSHFIGGEVDLYV
jgi:hypothetical protein